MKRSILILLTSSVLLTWNCSTQKKAASDTETLRLANEYPENISLAQILKRTPGLMLSGSGDDVKVRVRGLSTISGSQDPLYVVDGNIVGTSYQNVSQLNGHQIASVKVLKDAVSTSRYGMQGSNGVIVIKTKN